jgi:putative oxidoreductase
MAVLRAIARPMLAAVFIIQGYDTVRHPEKVAQRAEPVVRPLRERVPILPAETEDTVRLNGAVQVVAGSMLALGMWPRLAAAVLAGSLVPTTLAGHRYWEHEDQQTRAQHRIHFLKNVAVLGGLLIAAADTSGNPSLAWRGRHAVTAARHDVALATRTAKASSKAGARIGKAQGTADLVRARADTVLARADAARARAGRAGARKARRARARAGQQLSSLRPAG